MQLSRELKQFSLVKFPEYFLQGESPPYDTWNHLPSGDRISVAPVSLQLHSTGTMAADTGVLVTGAEAECPMPKTLSVSQQVQRTVSLNELQVLELACF